MGSFAEDMGTVEEVVSSVVIVGSVKMLKVVAVVVEFVKIQSPALAGGFFPTSATRAVFQG